MSKNNNFKSEFSQWFFSKTENQRKLILEMEMWLKGIDCFFYLDYHPLTDKELSLISLKEYNEELKVLSAVIGRLSRICSLLIDQELLLKSNFAFYIENILRGGLVQKNEFGNMLSNNEFDSELVRSIELFTTVKSLFESLSVSRITLPTFVNVGKLVHIQIFSVPLFKYMLCRPIDTKIDRIKNKPIKLVIHSIRDSFLRKSSGILIYKFFKLLNFLEYAKAYSENTMAIKKNIVIFVLIHYETKKIIDFMTKRFLYSDQVPVDFIDLIDGFIFSISMDMKKIIKKELVGFLGSNQASHLYTKIENSSGIMQNSLQQVIVSLGQYFDKTIEGTDVFEDFQTKLEQSLKLREEIWELMIISNKLVNDFEKTDDDIDISPLLTKLELFRKVSMKYLMYKDWYDFDNFYNELIKSINLKSLGLTLHKFATYLSTLLKEVNKRAVLYDFPFDKPLPEV